MVAFGKLGRYFGLHFLSAVMMVFSSLLGLIAIVDFFEFTRRLGGREGATALDIAELVALRLPVFSEQMLPFSVMIGATGSFLILSRRHEFIVARSAGVSVWQFIGLAVVIAASIGVFATAIYSPLSSAAWDRAVRIEAALFDENSTVFQSNTDGLWLRQQSVDGHAIVQAQAASDQGRKLSAVRVFAFDHAGHFVQRIDARSAQLQPGTWVLQKARVFSATSAPVEYETYRFSTNLIPEQVRVSSDVREAVSFWEVPAAVAAAERAGLRTERYRLLYQLYLVQPLVLATMVVIAAAFSLKVFRLGGVGKMMIGSVLAGFVLFLASKVGQELGANGFVDPILAVWLPIAFGASMGCLALLHQEDG